MARRISGVTVSDRRAQQGALRLSLFGPFRAIAPDGAELGAMGAKAQALLAMLALSPGRQRSRVWLQDRLWSDRDRERAAASLRQTLSEIRRSLGGFRDILQADRRMVALDRARLGLEAAPHAGAELLEGIDIRDRQFQAWLRLERLARCGAAPSTVTAPRPGAVPGALSIRLGEGGSETAAYLQHFVADLLAGNLRERADIPATIGGGEDGALCFAVRAADLGSGAELLLSLTHGWPPQFLWSRNCRVAHDGRAPGENVALLALINEAIETAVCAWSRPPGTQTPVPPMQAAIGKIFTFDPEELHLADRMLRDAAQRDTSGVALAWRLFLQMVLVVERELTPDGTVREQTEQMVVDELRAAPNNSLILSAASAANLKVLNRPEAAVELARRAVRLNAGNPFALDALANALLLSGATEPGYRLSRRTRAIAANSRFSHLFDMGCCLAATVTGRFDEARQLAEASAAMAPRFSPPLRYLTALHAHHGDVAAAHRAAAKLARIEKGFTPRQIVQDPDYPVAALRKAQLANQEVLIGL